MCASSTSQQQIFHNGTCQDGHPERYRLLLEDAYAAYGVVVTQVDELGQESESCSFRLCRVMWTKGSCVHDVSQNTFRHSQETFRCTVDV
jgi:hypothetical protein